MICRTGKSRPPAVRQESRPHPEKKGGWQGWIPIALPTGGAKPQVSMCSFILKVCMEGLNSNWKAWS